jgi:glucose uptake protein
MFVPHSFSLAIAMMIATAVCWGSFANTFKAIRNRRWELYYWDYALGIFLMSVLYAFTLGSGHGPSSFLANLRGADPSNVGWALLAGVIFNLANVLLIAGIDMAGLAVAFPISIGIALVVGVILSYALQPLGSVVMLGGGVAFALLAVFFDGRAYGQLGGVRRVSSKSVAICVVSGVLMGLWAPFSTRALTHGHPLTPYGVAVFLTLGALVSCLLWNVYFMRRPLVGEPVDLRDLFKGSFRAHLLGFIGGCIWATGMTFDLVAANFTGVAISYAIGQSSPMIAALWGVFAFREFAGANRKAITFLALMFACYVLAIVLVAAANRG